MPAALVTGASKGIGAATAKRLARDGFDVIVHYNSDVKGAKATAADIQHAGRKAIPVHADLAKPAGVRQLAQATLAAFPKLDALVLNAGAYDRRALADLDESAWRAALALNLDAPAFLTKRLAPHLARGAAVVFVSSVVAARGSSHGAAYAAAKAGLIGLTRNLARELAPVRVNAVAPGYIDTAILASDTPARRKTRALEVPVGRVGAPG